MEEITKKESAHDIYTFENKKIFVTRGVELTDSDLNHVADTIEQINGFRGQEVSSAFVNKRRDDDKIHGITILFKW